MHDYRKLLVWQKSKELAVEIYKLTSTFPSEEKYGLISQIRRSAVSVPANIAEGAGRKTKNSFKQFINISLGSVNELLTHLEIALELGMATKSEIENYLNRYTEIRKMLYGFYAKL